jgi:hypothetical protein
LGLSIFVNNKCSTTFAYSLFKMWHQFSQWSVVSIAMRVACQNVGHVQGDTYTQGRMIYICREAIHTFEWSAHWKVASVENSFW